MNDGEIDMMISFNPSEAAVAVTAGLLPDSVRTFTFAKGTIGNTSFVAIPWNAAHKEGAMVVANFLLEPATQAHAQDIRQMGNFTVLDVDRLAPADRARFAGLPKHPALPTAAELGAALLEPHPTWMTRITAMGPHTKSASGARRSLPRPSSAFRCDQRGDRHAAARVRLPRSAATPSLMAHAARVSARDQRDLTLVTGVVRRRRWRSRAVLRVGVTGCVRRAGAWLAPVLRHALAIAIGLARDRAIRMDRARSRRGSPVDAPPDVATVGDSRGLALVLGLLLKEVHIWLDDRGARIGACSADGDGARSAIRRSRRGSRCCCRRSIRRSGCRSTR
jgi:hypothetical protein